VCHAVNDVRSRAYLSPRKAGGRQPHDLRHRFGKHLVEEGVDLVTVSTLLGHSRLETTALYTQPGARDLEAAVGKLSIED
jgi:site-specific recombinase XerD